MRSQHTFRAEKRKAEALLQSLREQETQVFSVSVLIFSSATKLQGEIRHEFEKSSDEALPAHRKASLQ